MRIHPSLAVPVAALLFLTGCGKDSSRDASHGVEGGHSESSTGDIRTALRAELAEAKEHAAAKHLDKIHEPAAHIWSLAAKLRAAKSPYGRLFGLARDLDTQGDAGNAGGVAEILAALEKEIERPSSPDVPDSGAPLAASEHDEHGK